MICRQRRHEFVMRETFDDYRLLGGLDGLSYGSLVGLAQSAGCSRQAAEVAAAIAMAESSGNPDAYNPVGKDDSYGLWQINMLGRLGPERRAAFGLSSNRQLFDPATNARAMVAVSNGCSRWIPWTTYTSGAYRKFLNSSSVVAAAPNATDGAASADPPAGGDKGQSSAGGVSTILIAAGALILLAAIAR